MFTNDSTIVHVLSSVDWCRSAVHTASTSSHDDHILECTPVRRKQTPACLHRCAPPRCGVLAADSSGRRSSRPVHGWVSANELNIGLEFDATHLRLPPDSCAQPIARGRSCKALIMARTECTPECEGIQEAFAPNYAVRLPELECAGCCRSIARGAWEDVTPQQWATLCAKEEAIVSP
jgi:hypothetical protein